MAKIERYGGDLKAFASEQLTNERTLFGQVAIANDLTSQITAQFLRGWGIVGPSDQPSLQDFNAAMYTHGQLLAYLHQMGVAEYNAAQEYFVGSLAQTGGVLYMSQTAENVGNAPATSPANWKAFTADQATEMALGLVKIATQALTNAGADDATAVTPKKLAAATQGQKHTAFSTTGTATTQVITPVPAISAYAANQRFSVTFNVASGLNPTINISGIGAKSLKQYDSTGAKVAAVFFAGQISDIVYDGTDFVLLDQIASVDIDPWAAKFIGEIVYVPTHMAGFVEPPTNLTYRYVKLTASDAYNSGVVTSEAVSGVAPLVSATGVISLAGSPFNGQTVRLINSERRSIRPGSAGVIEQDAFQGHKLQLLSSSGDGFLHTTGATGPSASGTRWATSTANDPIVEAGSPVSDGTNGTPRAAIETRIKSLGLTAYMRIK